ncbi:unnamed protein product [Rhizophagus irregularis]|nr:unnamed protein product [Rhizophagus irregularis]
MNQHARLQIGAEIFGSMISGRHEKNANIFAKWKAANDDSVDTYPGEVQYYFEHALRFPEGTKTHLLAYVKWYKPALLLVFGLNIVLWSQKYQIPNYGKPNTFKKVVIPC